MHFDSIKKGMTVVIRTPDGDKQGKALRKEDDTWVLEGELTATPANVVRFLTKPRGDAGTKAEPPTTAPES